MAPIPGSRQAGTVYSVVLAGRDRFALSGVRGALESAGGFRVVGEARTSEGALPLSVRLEPDVVVLESEPGDPVGVGVVSRLRESSPATRVVVLSTALPGVVDSFLQAGAAAFVDKRIDPDELPRQVRGVFEPSDPGVAGEGRAELPDAPALSRGELEVIRAVAAGLANGAIATKLGITEHAVKYRISRILRKLGVRNRVQATRKAHDLGFLGSAGRSSSAAAPGRPTPDADGP